MQKLGKSVVYPWLAKLPTLWLDPPRILVLTAALCGPFFPSLSFAEEPTNVSLCEIVAQPDRYHLKTVSFQALFETDGRENSTLTKQSCPEIGIAPFLSPESWATLESDKNFCAFMPSTKIEATWSGRFHSEPRNGPGSGKYPRWIEIDHIDELSISPKDGMPKCPNYPNDSFDDLIKKTHMLNEKRELK